MRKYPKGEIVIYQGKQWRVVDFYFELRKLAPAGIVKLEDSDYRTVAEFELDKENAAESPEGETDK
jgi:hypothetical protein